MKKIWFDEAWEDYTYWQMQDKRTLKRINMLLKDIERGNFDGYWETRAIERRYEWVLES